jgi:hypothetical protein
MLLTVALIMATMMAAGAGPASAQTPGVPTGDQIAGFTTNVTGDALKLVSSPLDTKSATGFATDLAGGLTSLLGLSAK